MLCMSEMLYPAYLKVSSIYSTLLNEEQEATSALSNLVSSLPDEITPGLTVIGYVIGSVC